MKSWGATKTDSAPVSTPRNWSQESRCSWPDAEKVLCQFEEAWRKGLDPDPNDYLPESDCDYRRFVLHELIHIDMERRFTSGRPIALETYIDRFPTLADDPKGMVELIAAQCELHFRHDPSWIPESFFRRFPQYEEEVSGRFRKAKGNNAGMASQTGFPEIQGYEILELLGRGSMGVVFKARHAGLNRLVALKVVRFVGEAEEEQRQRFQSEAEAVARLQNPNIVQIFEIGSYLGNPFLCLEFVQGYTLAKHLSTTSMTPRASARLLAKLAIAMDHAHRQGIVHRDLKPANILLKCAGQSLKGPASALDETEIEPKITDFGLAKILDEGHSATRTGSVLGTPSYMSPEQAVGESRLVGPTSDIYSLGAIFYEMLTGRPPFRAATALEMLDLVRSEEPVALCRVQSGIPKDLETITLKCLAKDPARRYKTAKTVAEDIERHLNHEPILARPATPLERCSKWARRRPTTATLIASSLLFTIVLFWASATYTLELSKALTDTKLAEKRAIDRAREVKARLYGADMALSSQFWRGGNTQEVLSRLALHVPETGEEDSRGFEWRYLAHASQHGHQLKFEGHGSEVLCAAWAPQGNLLALASQDGSVRICDAITAEEKLRLAKQAEEIQILEFSNDGHRLISVDRKGTFTSWNVADGRLLSLTLSPVPDNVCLSLSPDQKHLALALRNGEIAIHETSLGKRIALLKGNDVSPTIMVLSGDQQTLITGDADGALHSWDLALGKIRWNWVGKHPITALTESGDFRRLASGNQKGLVQVHYHGDGKVFGEFPPHSGAVRSLAYSRDITQLASAGEEGIIQLHASIGSHKPILLRGHLAPTQELVFSPDGQKIASASRDGTVRIWETSRPPDHDTVGWEYHGIGPVIVASDGRTAAFADGRLIQIMDLQTLKVVASLSGRTIAWGDLAFSPNGKWLATSAHQNDELWLWDTATWQPQIKLPTNAGFLQRVVFSPDSRWLSGCFRDGLVRLWDLENHCREFLLSGHKGHIHSLVFNPSGSILISSGEDKTIRFWDVLFQKPIQSVEHPYSVVDLAVAPDGETLAFRDSLNTFHFSKMPKPLSGVGSSLTTHGFSGANNGRTLGYSPDGKRLISLFPAPGPMLVYDADTKTHVYTVATHRNQIDWFAWVPNGKSIITISSDGGFRLLDTKTWNFRQNPEQMTGIINGLAFASDGKKLLSTFEHRRQEITHRLIDNNKQMTVPAIDSVIKVWDVDTGRLVPTVDKAPPMMPIHTMTMVSDSQIVVGGVGNSLLECDLSSTNNKPIRFIYSDLDNEWPLWPWKTDVFYPDFRGFINALGISQDKKWLAASTTGGTIKTWSMPGWHEDDPLPGPFPGVSFLCISSDNRTLAFNSLGKLKIWDRQTKTLTTREAHYQPLGCGGLSPDGKILAAATEDWQIKLWNLEKGFQAVATLIGHTDRVTCLAFSPDSRSLASGGMDGTVRLWDPRTGQQLLTLEGHHGPVQALAFSPDGSVLASGAESGEHRSEIYLWKAPPTKSALTVKPRK